MQLYKLNIETAGGFFLKLNSLEEAKAYNSYIILFENYVPNINEKLESDKSFCLFLTDRFLKENREADITETESLELMQQFNSILSFAQVGAVPTVKSLLQGVTVGRVYTQERKNKDLSDIQNYLNQ
jgi:hypothetical protein